MTPPPSPPKRHRRRIVVSAIAVLVLGLGWWFWPRVDQRLVGKWEVPKGWFQVKASVYEFQADGWGRRIEHPSGMPFDDTRSLEMTFRWWIKGDHLVMEVNNLSGVERLRAQAQTAFAPLLGLKPQLSRELRRIYDVTDDALKMDVQTNYRGVFIVAGTVQPTTLRRVQE